jgi:hypothetical protein
MTNMKNFIKFMNRAKENNDRLSAKELEEYPWLKHFKKLFPNPGVFLFCDKEPCFIPASWSIFSKKLCHLHKEEFVNLIKRRY